MNWLRRLFARRPNPTADFRARSAELLARWFAVASAAGKPRGLRWLGFDPTGEPLFARDGKRLLALAPVAVRFEPDPHGELADVPQATGARPVVAVFQHRNGRWETDGRAVYNLNPVQLLDREPGRYQLLREGER